MNVICAVAGHIPTKREVVYTDAFITDVRENDGKLFLSLDLASNLVTYNGCARCNPNPRKGSFSTKIGSRFEVSLNASVARELFTLSRMDFRPILESLVGHTETFTKLVEDGSVELAHWWKEHGELVKFREEEFGLGYSRPNNECQKSYTRHYVNLTKIGEILYNQKA